MCHCKQIVEGTHLNRASSASKRPNVSRVNAPVKYMNRDRNGLSLLVFRAEETQLQEKKVSFDGSSSE